MDKFGAIWNLVWSLVALITIALMILFKEPFVQRNRDFFTRSFGKNNFWNNFSEEYLFKFIYVICGIFLLGALYALYNSISFLLTH